jgi:hypothetical protein
MLVELPTLFFLISLTLRERRLRNEGQRQKKAKEICCPVNEAEKEKRAEHA